MSAGAGELGNEAVAGTTEDPAAVDSNKWVCDFTTGPERSECDDAFFVFSNQPRITDDVRSQDRDEFSLCFALGHTAPEIDPVLSYAKW